MRNDGVNRLVVALHCGGRRALHLLPQLMQHLVQARVLYVRGQLLGPGGLYIKEDAKLKAQNLQKCLNIIGINKINDCQ